MTTSKPKRRFLRFSLRTLIVFIVAVSVLMGWFAMRLERVRRERAVVERVVGMGGRVTYGYYGYDSSGWRQKDGTLISLPLGYDFFHNVHSIDCPPEFGDDDAVHLRRLTDVDTLLLGRTQITDAALENVRGLANLRVLYVDETQVTDEGLERLQPLNLKYLGLRGTQVTDEGLRYMRRLGSLEGLGLDDTHITDVGLEHLTVLTNWDSLDLSRTQVGDGGLAHLKGLTNLEHLELDDTQVTDAGLEHLHALTTLKRLHLNGTQVTIEGVKKLQQALPNCKIEH